MQTYQFGAKQMTSGKSSVTFAPNDNSLPKWLFIKILQPGLIQTNRALIQGHYRETGPISNMKNSTWPPIFKRDRLEKKIHHNSCNLNTVISEWFSENLYFWNRLYVDPDSLTLNWKLADCRRSWPESEILLLSDLSFLQLRLENRIEQLNQAQKWWIF